MTCREKLKEQHPDWSQDEFDHAVNGECPYAYIDIDTPKDEFGFLWCGTDRCDECWYREVPEKPLTYEHTGEPIGKVTELTMNDNGVIAKIEPTNSYYVQNEKEKNMPTRKTKAELEKELETVKESKEELEKELQNLEKYKQYEDMAGEIHALYMAYVHAGFSEEQAYDLLKTMIQNAGNITFNTAITPTYKNRR